MAARCGWRFPKLQRGLGDLLAGTWQLSKHCFQATCMSILKDWMDKHSAPWGFPTGRSLLCPKEAHMRALEEKVYWRRARWPASGCTSAAPSAPWAVGWGCVGAWICPRRALQGSSGDAPVFLSRHLPRTDVPEAERRDPAGEWQSHGPGHGCAQPGEEVLLRCRSGPDTLAGGRLLQGRAAQGRL